PRRARSAALQHPRRRNYQHWALLAPAQRAARSARMALGPGHALPGRQLSQLRAAAVAWAIPALAAAETAPPRRRRTIRSAALRCSAGGATTGRGARGADRRVGRID